MISSYDKKSDQVRDISQDPERMVDKIASAHADLNKISPEIGAGVQGVAMNAINFLNQKMPKPAVEFPGTKWKPNDTQKKDWLDYHEIVSDPVKILDHVRHGTLNTKHMEAIQAVHPDLLSEMQQKVMAGADEKSLKNVHYSTKMAISKFLGQPIHQSFLPGVIANDQMNYQMPSPSSPQMQAAKHQSQSGVNKMDLAQQSATRTQKAEGLSQK